MIAWEKPGGETYICKHPSWSNFFIIWYSRIFILDTLTVSACPGGGQPPWNLNAQDFCMNSTGNTLALSRPNRAPGIAHSLFLAAPALHNWTAYSYFVLHSSGTRAPLSKEEHLPSITMTECESSIYFCQQHYSNATSNKLKSKYLLQVKENFRGMVSWFP